MKALFRLSLGGLVCWLSLTREHSQFCKASREILTALTAASPLTGKLQDCYLIRYFKDTQARAIADIRGLPSKNICTCLWLDGASMILFLVMNILYFLFLPALAGKNSCTGPHTRKVWDGVQIIACQLKLNIHWRIILITINRKETPQPMTTEIYLPHYSSCVFFYS